ncbi:uncharacterized protein ASCRUDRAFT_76779 [Ascoidea rubescens DSM 1968]|uniref:Pore membrane protein of 33 kDa n=1 Tax=Ascoidea rubescens DSM 1968 TaxID=1344418 RepID=A0A1D2VDP3_9ASCO|nr:hypothetical protein ASCRUDRAFT_76779 [Ascoidea rubescens DSM 1968]ODV59828.1 hypothetical protein ASCRUDRAFT_76779 [Ascoidea rubescens DSM 1968]
MASQAQPLPTIKDNLIALAKTAQFAWFSGHIITLTSAFWYLLSFKSNSLTKFWYRLFFLGVIESFGVIIFQAYKSGPFNVKKILNDDNVQYLYAALLWLFSPITTLALFPFIFFSIFHTLTYSRACLFPALNIQSDSAISKTIANFIRTNNDKSIRLAANFELILFVWLFFKLLTFKSSAWLDFILYFFFIKVRYEKSVFSRETLSEWVVRVDSLVADPRVPPQIKNYYTEFKTIARKTLGKPLLSSPSVPSKKN